MGALQMPSVQGTMLQQSPSIVHDCPYSAQEPGSPQVPVVAPGGMTQGIVLQQSAELVQAPMVGTHSPPHTSGGNSPLELGTHGSPQQSALDEQGMPSNTDGSAQS